MEIRNGISITLKNVMNNLVKIREKFKRSERIHQAQLLATKNGEVTPYRKSIFKRRQQKAIEDLAKD